MSTNSQQPLPATEASQQKLIKRINNERDVIYFKTKSPAYKCILAYVELLSDRIYGAGNKVLNHKYTCQERVFQECSSFIDELGRLCDETNLNIGKTSVASRFGHAAYRDWFDEMKIKSREFINDKLAVVCDEQFREELYIYFTESFGNRTRIDYGTGHELYFIIFTMGLIDLVGKKTTNPTNQGDEINTSQLLLHQPLTPERLKVFVHEHGWDVLSLFAQRYLRLCRKVQTKFRLEPAGSRGVYNMDDFQFLPFLFGAAQLIGAKYVPVQDFYLPEQVDMFKNDFLLMEAVDFILTNKRGPFNEHSYTLWCLTNLGSWENIYRRVRMKFAEDILGPFPIIQHFLFGKYILRWDDSE